MKRQLSISFLLLCLFAMPAIGQQNAISGFNSFIGGGAPTYYTKLDTVTNTGVDTFGTAMDPYRNSIGFQIDVTKISGNPAGAYIQLWGSKEMSQTSGGYYLIATDTIRNISAMQVFNHDIGAVTNSISSGGVITPTTFGYGGNPCRWYLLTIQGAGTSSISWKGIVLIR